MVKAMKKLCITTASIIDNKTIKLDEPIDMNNGKIKISIEPIPKKNKISKRVFGCTKDWVVVKDDFYAPLEEFEKYKK